MLSSQSAAVAQAGTKLSQVLTCVAQVLAIADCRQLTALVGHAVLAQVSNALIAASSAGKPVVPQPVAQELRVPPPVMVPVTPSLIVTLKADVDEGVLVSNGLSALFLQEERRVRATAPLSKVVLRILFIGVFFLIWNANIETEMKDPAASSGVS